MSIDRTNRKCGHCEHYAEPVCAKKRPCEKSLPCCADFFIQGKAGGDVDDFVLGIKNVVQDAFDIFKSEHRGTPTSSLIVTGLPYCYIGLLRFINGGAESGGTEEIKEEGYRRLEMCPCDWDYLLKVIGKNGINRCFCPSTKKSSDSKLVGGKLIQFNFNRNTIFSYNTVTNGLDIQWCESKSEWEQIDCFGLYLNEKCGEPSFIFKLNEACNIPKGERPTFLSGQMEIPVEIIVNLNAVKG